MDTNIIVMIGMITVCVVVFFGIALDIHEDNKKIEQYNREHNLYTNDDSYDGM